MVEYPFFAVTAGMAFFFLGSSYWGWCYAFGLAFFALSVLMLFNTDWAVLEFGAIWTACLVILGAAAVAGEGKGRLAATRQGSARVEALPCRVAAKRRRGHGLLMPTKPPSFSRASADKNAPTSGLS